MAENKKRTYFTSKEPELYIVWSCKKVCESFHYHLYNIFIGFVPELYMYRHVIGIIPMGANCAHLFADLFLFCYERLHAVFLTICKVVLLKHLTLLQDI